MQGASSAENVTSRNVIFGEALRHCSRLQSASPLPPSSVTSRNKYTVESHEHKLYVGRWPTRVSRCVPAHEDGHGCLVFRSTGAYSHYPCGSIVRERYWQFRLLQSVFSTALTLRFESFGGLGRPCRALQAPFYYYL